MVTNTVNYGLAIHSFGFGTGRQKSYAYMTDEEKRIKNAKKTFPDEGFSNNTHTLVVVGGNNIGLREKGALGNLAVFKSLSGKVTPWYDYNSGSAEFTVPIINNRREQLTQLAIDILDLNSNKK